MGGDTGEIIVAYSLFQNIEPCQLFSSVRISVPHEVKLGALLATRVGNTHYRRLGLSLLDYAIHVICIMKITLFRAVRDAACKPLSQGRTINNGN
jgi:hypothetical protein